MTDVNLQLVRECFELNVFRVLTNWQQEPWRNHAVERSPQLFVENTAETSPRELPFQLNAHDIAYIDRAVVHVRAWHADRFYPSVIESSPVLSRFEASEAATIAQHVFDGRPYKTLLVLSELPVSRDQRSRSLGLLSEAGVDHIIEFRYVLQDILERVSVNCNYTASPTLQTLRLLKRYKLVRNQQLEFAFRIDPPAPPTPPVVDSQEIPSDEADE